MYGYRLKKNYEYTTDTTTDVIPIQKLMIFVIKLAFAITINISQSIAVNNIIYGLSLVNQCFPLS